MLRRTARGGPVSRTPPRQSLTGRQHSDSKLFSTCLAASTGAAESTATTSRLFSPTAITSAAEPVAGGNAHGRSTEKDSLVRKNTRGPTETVSVRTSTLGPTETPAVRQRRRRSDRDTGRPTEIPTVRQRSRRSDRNTAVRQRSRRSDRDPGGPTEIPAVPTEIRQSDRDAGGSAGKPRPEPLTFRRRALPILQLGGPLTCTFSDLGDCDRSRHVACCAGGTWERDVSKTWTHGSWPTPSRRGLSPAQGNTTPHELTSKFCDQLRSAAGSVASEHR
jgi:hypothetical protein